MNGPRRIAGRLRQAVSRQAVSRRPHVSAATGVSLAAVTALSLTLTPQPASRAAPERSLAAATVARWPTVTAQTTPTPAPARPKGPLLDPFTGKRVKALGPVLAVKIDNIVYARPQTGLRSADLIYVIPVEGGLTRYMAVYSSHVPPTVGPVRSARESDLDLLRQFGRPAFAWSGAAPHLVPFIERAPVVDLYALQAGGYYRSASRAAPYNLYASARQLVTEAHGASKARDIGFRFGSLPAGGKAAGSFSVKYPAASYTFRWSAKARRWLTWVDGAPAQAAEGGQLGGSTVVIQFTHIATSRFLEYGGRPPYAKSVGHGNAVILRDGREYTVRWSRPSLNSGTTYTLSNGKRMLFAPGQVWVVLAPDSHASYVNAGKV